MRVLPVICLALALAGCGERAESTLFDKPPVVAPAPTAADDLVEVCSGGYVYYYTKYNTGGHSPLQQKFVNMGAVIYMATCED